jgi:hypothetical protein
MLTDILEELGAADGVIAQQVQEMQKEASEDEFAGRIAARGFYDELQKLAGAQRVTFGPGEGSKVTGKPAAAPGTAPAPVVAPPKPPAPGGPSGGGGASGAMGAIAKATGPGTAFGKLTAPAPKK